ncbi:hypothetical protein ABO04_06465 [Nitrosomonas sp. HPC101]|nr:hypothetical protein [Nitrosomonas sp. HPC101]
MESCHILDLNTIRKSLNEVQKQFESIRTQLDEQRDPPDDMVCDNMLQGYALIDKLITEGADLFDLQQIDWMIEINTMVLCGADPERRKEFSRHIAMTRSRFFDSSEGGARDLLEWHRLHRGESAWKQAAGVFVRILSKPQLFIEGNHRSASLIASFLLVREGLPPFVLSTDNAVGFFNPASVIRRVPKNGLSALFRLPKIKKKYAAFLEDHASSKFLLKKHKRATKNRAR